jgi:uncharacterized protein YbjT (DUF2867 family)
MSDQPRILVTGASGNVGSAVVNSLHGRGAIVRVAQRTRSAAPRDAQVEPVLLDFAERETFAGAVRGCHAVFLVRPPAIANVGATLLPFVDEARRAGVEHIVFLSVVGADKNAFIPHHAVEAHLRQTPAHTFLRAGFFAQNMGDAYRLDIRDDDRIYVPAGRGRVAFVDVADIGELAARVLLAPAAHRGQAYVLTGPEALSFEEAAAVLSQALGRPIRYEAASVVGYVTHLRKRGLPWAQAFVQAALHVGLRFGQAEPVDPTLPALLGRPARRFAEYVLEHCHLWRKE